LCEPSYVINDSRSNSLALNSPLYLAVVEWYLRLKKLFFSVEHEKTQSNAKRSHNFFIRQLVILFNSSIIN